MSWRTQSRAAYVAEKAGPDAALKSILDQWRATPLSSSDKALIKSLLSKADLNAARTMAEERGREDVAALIRQYQERYGAMELARQKLVADVGPRIGMYFGGKSRRRRTLYRKRRVTRKRTVRKH